MWTQRKAWLAAIVGFLITSIEVNAQEQALFFTNPYSFNPSYAGVEGRPALFLSYRRQWINVDGSPRLANLSLHTPLKNLVSGGVAIHHDTRGLFNTTSGLVSAAYTVWLGDFQTLRFGMSAGVGSSRLDLAAADDAQDPALLGAGRTSVLGNAGVSFHSKFFHGGIAIPYLFGNSFNKEIPTSFDPFQTVIIHASNRFYWHRDKHLLEPYFIYHYNRNIPSQLELALVYHMNDVLWAGGAYKQHIGSSAFAGFHLNKVLGIGYAYTFKVATGSELNSPSHEVQLTLLLGERQRKLPFYSFVDTDKGRKVHHHTQARKPAPEKHPTETPAVKPEPAREEVVAEEKPKEEPVVAEKNEEPQEQPVAAEQQEEPEPQIPALEIEAAPVEENARAEVKDTARVETIQPAAPVREHTPEPGERHELVKMGDHHEELDIADYVIAGVFKSRANAEHFASGLEKLGYPADFGHLSANNLWYVFIVKTDDLTVARSERNRYRKITIFKDVWLLTVHE